jgi:propionate CoA-transferase
MDGREYLRYKPFPVHVALVRASAADDDGNISFEHEAANLDAQSLALAARNSGGRVLVQVKERLPRGALKAREVRIPSAWVDAIVVDPPAQQLRHPVRTRASAASSPAHARDSEAADHARELAAASEVFASARRSPPRGRASCSTPASRARWSTTAWACPTRWPNWWHCAASSHRIYQTIEHGTYGGTADGRRAVRLCAQRQRHAGRAHAIRLLCRWRPGHRLSWASANSMPRAT